MTETLSMPSKTAVETTKPAAERRVAVKLLNDVWINDPGHPDATPDGIRRVRTNVVTLNEDGSQMVDKKTKSFVSTHVIAEIPVDIAKALIAAGKAERTDPL